MFCFVVLNISFVLISVSFFLEKWWKYHIENITDKSVYIVYSSRVVLNK